MARKRTRNYRAERSEEFVDEEEKGEEDEVAADEDEDEDEEAADEEDEDAAEEEEDASSEDDDEDEPKAKKIKKATKVKKPTVRRTRAVKVVRKRAIWVVLDNSSKPIEKFPYNQKAEAEKFLEEKNTEKKGFYIQMVKEEME